MKGDSLAVVALMLGFLSMVAVGVWVRLDEETRTTIVRTKGQCAACAGAVAGVLVLLLTI